MIPCSLLERGNNIPFLDPPHPSFLAIHNAPSDHNRLQPELPEWESMSTVGCLSTKYSQIGRKADRQFERIPGGQCADSRSLGNGSVWSSEIVWKYELLQRYGPSYQPRSSGKRDQDVHHSEYIIEPYASCCSKLRAFLEKQSERQRDIQDHRRSPGRIRSLSARGLLPQGDARISHPSGI